MNHAKDKIRYRLLHQPSTSERQEQKRKERKERKQKAISAPVPPGSRAVTPFRCRQCENHQQPPPTQHTKVFKYQSTVSVHAGIIALGNYLPITHCTSAARGPSSMTGCKFPPVHHEYPLWGFRCELIQLSSYYFYSCSQDFLAFIFISFA